MITRKKIVVGMSGGVDSAVSALLLKNKGFDVHGVFMKNWDWTEETGTCTGPKDLEDAEWACSRLKIPLTGINFVKEYWNNVFSQLVADYEGGLTPNPDILCNKHIKFDSFFDYAQRNLKADAIATGHYARTTFGTYLENYKHHEDVKLLKAKDSFKDQTFFLCGISQKALRHVMFPVGDLMKTEVKRIAAEAGLLRLAKKRESTGICFVGKRDFQKFISEYISPKSGDFIDIDTGNIVGKHQGAHMWTIGQRAKIKGTVKPYFISRKLNYSTNILVAAGTDHLSLLTRFVIANNPNWISGIPSELEANNILRCEFRFQHTKPLVSCFIVRSHSGNLLIMLNTPLRAITPGQYATFYKNDECLGGARILKPGPSLLYLQNS